MVDNKERCLMLVKDVFVVGDVHIADMERLSDYLQSMEAELRVSNSKVFLKTGALLYTARFMVINKKRLRHITPITSLKSIFKDYKAFLDPYVEEKKTSPGGAVNVTEDDRKSILAELSDKSTTRAERVVMITQTGIVEGSIRKESDQRLSDYLGRASEYIRVTDVTMKDRNQKKMALAEFLAIHRDELLVTMPISEIV